MSVDKLLPPAAPPRPAVRAIRILLCCALLVGTLARDVVRGTSPEASDTVSVGSQLAPPRPARKTSVQVVRVECLPSRTVEGGGSADSRDSSDSLASVHDTDDEILS